MDISYNVLKPQDKYWALDQIMALVDHSKAQGNAPHLNLQEIDFYQRFFEGEGVAIGAFEMDRLVGFALLGLEPFLSEIWDPYLEKMGIPRIEAAVLIHTLLSPHHRGKGIGKSLTRHRLHVAHTLGRTHLFATVSPKNLPVQGILKQYGFGILERRKLYTKQLDRYLIYSHQVEMPLDEVPTLGESKPLVLIDSGFGGLNVAAALQETLADSTHPTYPLPLYYVNASPSDERGYNQMSSQEEKIEVFFSVLREIQKKFMPQAIYIACNTLSVLVPQLPKEITQNCTLLGIIESGVSQMLHFQQRYPHSKILLFATETTIESGIYPAKLAEMGGDLERMISIPAPNLATTISNDQSGHQVASLIHRLVDQNIDQLPLDGNGIGLFLGCTHYGYRTELFKEAFKRYGIKTHILDPNRAFSQEILQHAGIKISPSSMHFFSPYALPQSEVVNISSLLKKRSPLLSEAVLNYHLLDIRTNPTPQSTLSP
jgi:glutamate racemase/ribosomal protein S18 acetylase RimI-like enzyme